MSGTAPRRRFTWRRLRLAVAYLLALVLILAGVAVGMTERLLPLLAQHPEKVAAWLSERIGQPVEISAVEARWSRSGPKLGLHGLRIGSGAEGIGIGSAQLSVNVYSGVWPGIPFTDLRIDALHLNLIRGREDRRWRLEGFPATPDGDAAAFDLKRLKGLGALEVVSARLHVLDETDGHSLVIEHADARMQRDGQDVRFGLRARRDSGATLRLAGVVSEDGSSGLLYAEGIAQDWAAWSAAWPFLGLHIGQARGDLRAWLDFSDHRIDQVRIEAGLAPLELVGEIAQDDSTADAEPAQATHGSAPNLRFSEFSSRLRWRRETGGWRIDAPQTLARIEPTAPAHEMQAAGTPVEPADTHTPAIADLSVVQRDADGSVHVRAAAFALEPALALLSATDLLPQKARALLASAEPSGHIHELDLQWRSSRDFLLSATLDDLGWKASGSLPSLRGIGGRLDADPGLWRLAITPGIWQVLAPGMLRGPFAPQVQGDLLAYPDEGAWRVETTGLTLSEQGQYDIELGGGATFLPDDGGVELTLRSAVGPAPIVVAKRFWPMNVMPSKAVEWLDDALLDGQLTRGSALFHGNLGDWPFDHAEGRFEALAELDGTKLRYHSDWPSGDSVSGTARFVNTAMEVDLSARVGKARVLRTTGGIADFGDAILDLSIKAEGRGAALLDVLQRSSLGKGHRNLIDGLGIGGQGDVAMQLHIPLEEHLGELRLSGQVDLARADLSHTGWGIAFEAASGRVRFSERGFSADELNVGFANSLGALSVAVGGYTSGPANVAEASLRGHFAAQGMIAASPQAQWLKPWLHGDSDWTLQLSVPDSEDGQDRPPKLRLRSDLAGTAISLPAPLRKAARGRMPLDITLELPTTHGAIDLRLGSLLHLVGRHDPATGLTGIASFGDQPDTTLPERGLHIAGQVPAIDGGAWISVATSGSGGEGLHIASVDLLAGELDLLGRPFRETRLRLTQIQGERIDLDFAGPMLQGRVQVPLAQLALRGITAHLQKLVWPSIDTEPAPASVHGGDLPPQAVPPLHLDIADLEFAGAKLGETRLETWPTPAGMHVERLETRSPALDLRVQGEWTLENGVERSAFTADLSSGDLGAMLAALGFSRLVDGGPSVVKIALDWPGAPGAFEFASVNGTLSASVGKGRILEVEPGAGRLFGLLSLVEIPRRLTLDFSDIFKSGFAFNQMHGSFTIVEGDAATGDFRIDAPSAEIRITGRTGLATRDYDQRMEVLPKASNVLPAIGAIAGGPAGAAVGAVAQAVLQNPLKQMTRAVYQVSGPWSGPKIDRIERRAEHGRSATPAP